MEGVKRGRGRPPGTGDDDAEALMMVARLVASDPPMKPTAAMKRVRNVGQWRAASDDALIRRWQVKWKAEGSAYKARVQAEVAAAEAERQRRELAAAEAREMSRKSWPEIMAEAREAGRMPGLTVSKELREMLERHDRMMGSLSVGWRALAAGGALPKTGITAFETFGDTRRYGLAGAEALRGTMGSVYERELQELMKRSGAMGIAGRVSVLDNPGLAETMRKYGDMGRTLKDASAFVQGFKPPKGF